jgi:hypothetical protein
MKKDSTIQNENAFAIEEIDKTYEKKYAEIVKDYPASNQQWTTKGDAFVKFSLYKEIPSIATDGTFYMK